MLRSRRSCNSKPESFDAKFGLVVSWAQVAIKTTEQQIQQSCWFVHEQKNQLGTVINVQHLQITYLGSKRKCFSSRLTKTDEITLLVMKLRGGEAKIGSSKVSMLGLNLWRDYHLPIRERNFKRSICLAVSPLKCYMHINRWLHEDILMKHTFPSPFFSASLMFAWC